MSAIIPSIYYYTFIWAEGFMMVGGTIQAIGWPSKLLEFSMPNVPYSDALRPVIFQMAGSWLVLIWMRVMMAVFYPNDLAIWRHLLGASLVSDCFYLGGNIMDLGLARFFNPARWTLGDALTIITTVLPLVAKVFFLAGVGLPPQRSIRLDEPASERVSEATPAAAVTGAQASES